jgi:hypothetical protein
MPKNNRRFFERVAGPLRVMTERLAVGRCPSCGTQHSLFIDLKTAEWRCGRLPDALVRGTNAVSKENAAGGA